MSYRQTLAQLFWRAVEDPEFFHSIKSHKRYHLRLIAIIANNIGLFFNILAVCLAHDKILNGLAFLPLCVSLLWNVSDLISNRVFKHGMPLRLVAWIDLLGFVAFLVFLIVNGIIATSEDKTSVVILLAYTSVPWMFCCIVHGLVAAQLVLPYPFGNLQLNVNPECPNCHRKHYTRDGETFALIHDEDDIESHAAGAKVNDGEATARTQRQQSDL